MQAINLLPFFCSLHKNAKYQTVRWISCFVLHLRASSSASSASISLFTVCCHSHSAVISLVIRRQRARLLLIRLAFSFLISTFCRIAIALIRLTRQQQWKNNINRDTGKSICVFATHFNYYFCQCCDVMRIDVVTIIIFPKRREIIKLLTISALSSRRNISK